MSALWSKMPCGWQTQPNHHQAIISSDRGDAIAALKLYITLCLKANFLPNATFSSSGCVKKSITDFCKLTKLSRPMVVRGFRQLKIWGFVTSKAGRPTIYQINNYDDAKYWVKLPRSHLFSTPNERVITKLISLSNRRSASLHALQLYLYLASISNGVSKKAKVTYDKISEVLGVNRNEVSRAISLLIACDLVTVRQDDTDIEQHMHSCNVYTLRGSIAEK